MLLAHALGRERVYLYSHPEEELSEIAWMHFGRYLQERLDGVPTQYITGVQEFYGRDFLVTPDVLIPRPETEHLIEAALALVPRRVCWTSAAAPAPSPSRSASRCTAEVAACDISLAALKVAAENARRLEARVRFVAGDLLGVLPPAPSIWWFPILPTSPTRCRGLAARSPRPRTARGAVRRPNGAGGLLPAWLLDAERVLQPGGSLVMELGFRTSDLVREMLGPMWQDVQILPDLAGIPRVHLGEAAGIAEV